MPDIDSGCDISDIKIGISACLLGHRVRYDGQDKTQPQILALCQQIQCVAICPEYAAGLGVPRPPLILMLDPGTATPGINIRLRPVDQDAPNLTQLITGYAELIKQTYDLDGYIFKARSPSCGLRDIPLYDQNHKQRDSTQGIFSHAIQRLIPELPVIDETELEDNNVIEEFIRSALSFRRRRINHTEC